MPRSAGAERRAADPTLRVSQVTSLAELIQAGENTTTLSGVYTEVFDQVLLNLPASSIAAAWPDPRWQAVQAVDPSVQPPFFDPAKSPQHKPRVIQWKAPPTLPPRLLRR